MTSPLHIISAGAAMGLIRTCLGEDVEGQFGAVSLMLKKFQAGEPCDVLVLTRAQIDELAQKGLVQPLSIVDLGWVKTGLAVRNTDTQAPSITDTESLKSAVLQASSLFTPDMNQSTAGQHVARMLQSLGIWDDMKRKISEYPNGATAMRFMGATTPQMQANPLGCTQVTEILYTPSVRLIGLLPVQYELSTRYSMAIPTACAHPEAAHAAVAKLTGAEHAQSRSAAGFENQP